MHRYTFAVQRPGYVDAASLEAAIKLALQTHIVNVVEGEIPRKAVVEVLVTDKPNPAGHFTATAYHQGELIASCDAASPERALVAIGMNDATTKGQKSHTSRVYRQRFGDNYELVMRAASQPTKI